MVYDWQDLSGIREQILSNVSIAFPLISPHGITPIKHASGNTYNIIVRRMQTAAYQAVVVYGPTNRVFAVGANGESDRMALLTLLDATHVLIGKLYDDKKLPLLHDDNKANIIPNGLYEPRAGC